VLAHLLISLDFLWRNLLEFIWKAKGVATMKKALLGVVVLVILLGVSTLSITQPEKGTRLRPHAPIYIDGNDAFTPENGVVSGSGTEDDPYVIEGWEIDATGTDFAIRICGTDAWFHIRNCWVYGALTFGIVLHEARNGKVTNCIAEKTGNGVTLSGAENVEVIGNELRNNQHAGITLWGSRRNLIAENAIYGNGLIEGPHGYGCGIYMDYSTENKIFANHVFSNHYGIFLGRAANNNVIVGNTFFDNAEGITLWDQLSDNHFYWNNMMFQTQKLVEDPNPSKENSWDNGSEGNYWSDYSGWDSDGDGISDFPYRIEGGGIDRYPLMRPWKPSVVAMGIKFTGPDEFVTVRNWGEEEVDLTGWQLQSLDLQTREVQHSFLFPDGCILPAEGRLRVHSGPEAAGRDNELCGATELDLYQGWQDIEEGAIVWDDVGGVVRLINDRGEVVDEYEYHWWRGG